MKKYADSDSEIDDEDIDKLETLLARRFHKGKEKYKCKMPVICFNCHEVGHIAARCPEKKKNRDDKYEDKYKRRKDDDSKIYKDNGKKSCYIAEKESDSESSMSNEIELSSICYNEG